MKEKTIEIILIFCLLLGGCANNNSNKYLEEKETLSFLETEEKEQLKEKESSKRFEEMKDQMVKKKNSKLPEETNNQTFNKISKERENLQPVEESKSYQETKEKENLQSIEESKSYQETKEKESLQPIEESKSYQETKEKESLQPIEESLDHKEETISMPISEEGEQTQKKQEKPENHTCSFNNEKIVEAATCISNGRKIVTCFCGTEKTEVIQATGHSWNEVSWFEPRTCTAPGWWNRKCTICGETEGGRGEKLEHSWDEGVANMSCDYGSIQYTCVICGAEKREENSGIGFHSWGDSDIEGYQKCSVCDIYEIKEKEEGF